MLLDAQKTKSKVHVLDVDRVSTTDSGRNALTLKLPFNTSLATTPRSRWRSTGVGGKPRDGDAGRVTAGVTG
jgi:hypothetical protein